MKTRVKPSATSILDLMVDGAVRLAARGDPADDGSWTTREILEEVPHEDMDLGLSVEDGRIELRLSAHHVEGEGAGVWHLTQSVQLSREDAHALVDWVNFALRRAREER